MNTVIREISEHHPGFRAELNTFLYAKNPDLAKAEITVLSFMHIKRPATKKEMQKALATILKAMASIKPYELKFVSVDQAGKEIPNVEPEYRRWSGKDIAYERFAYLQKVVTHKVLGE